MTPKILPMFQENKSFDYADNKFEILSTPETTPYTDLSASIPFSAINSIAADIYPILESKLKNLKIDHTVLDLKLGVLGTANLTLGTIQNITFDYSKSVLISGVDSTDPNVSKAQLHLQNIGISMDFTYALNFFNYITDAHPATFHMNGLSLPIELTLENPTSSNWTVGASLGQATLKELLIDFNEKFPLSPLSTIWNILAGNPADQQRLVNELISLINPVLSTVKLNYNMPIKTNLKGVDVTLALTEPLKFQKLGANWNAQVKGGASLAYKGETAPDVYDPNMNIKPVQTNSAQLNISSNIVNNLLWAVFKSGMGHLSISQATLDALKIDLLSLYTNDVTILFMNILTKYPANKGLYMNVNLDEYDPATTRVSMVQGRLGILLKAGLQVFVDTESSKYPQNFADCTTCEKAADMTLDVFVGVSASFTNDKHLWFTTPEINIYKLVTNSSTFKIDTEFFRSSINSLVASIIGAIDNGVDISKGPLANMNPQIDILRELLHIQLDL